MLNGFVRPTILFLLSLTAIACAMDAENADLFGADDLHLVGKTVTTYQSDSDEYIMVFEDEFDFVIGDNKINSSNAVVWVKPIRYEYRGVESFDYRVAVCFQGKLKESLGKGFRTAGLDLVTNELTSEKSMIAEFTVSGEIFATAEKRIIGDPRSMKIYQNALVAAGKVQLVPIKPEAVFAADPTTSISPAPGTKGGRKLGVFEKIFGVDRKGTRPGSRTAALKKDAQDTDAQTLPPVPVPNFQYPVNITGIGNEKVKIQNERLADGSSIATILNRFYLWQKKDEIGTVVELQADSAVIFYSGNPGGNGAAGSSSAIRAIYLTGDVVMTEGLRTTRCDQAYYDFQRRQGLAVNAVMRTYDIARGIPIYVRAEKLRQVADNKFAAEDVVMTTSEFHSPQIQMTVGDIVIEDTKSIEHSLGVLDRNFSYDVYMRDVRFKANDRTFFWLPVMSTDLIRPDIPIKTLSISRDGDFGTAIESEWYLSRVLGLRQPKGVESTLAIDSYSKRGFGTGTKIKYERDDYFGNIDSYVIRDRGKDDLGRNRQNIEHEQKYRGKFEFQHRHYLPYNWQLTLETSYLSDQNYQESFNRDDFFTGKDEETLVHLKRLQDNWAFAILGKWQINSFQDQTEELPSAQYHLTGQSLFNDKFTLYHDSEVGRFRKQHGRLYSLGNISESYYTYGSTRTELDMPLQIGNMKLVPYIAGTYGFDDRSGFERTLVDNTGGGQKGDKNIFIGEVGMRISKQYWKLYQDIRSEYWDLEGLRHLIKPYATMSFFAESSDNVEQKNTINVGVLQRWQTKRGPAEKQRIVEWMRLDTNITWVGDSDSGISRPDKFVYNRPFVPMGVFTAPDMFNGDSDVYRSFETFGPQRNCFNADYLWRISDTTVLLSDMNYDLEDNELEQYNIGFSRLRWPNLSYYIGSRYLRSTSVDGEEGSNAVTFAITYKINSRYTVTFTQQHDYDYGKLLYREFALVRRYHRMYWAITASKDESLDRSTIVFSIWPEGIGELKNDMGLNAPEQRGY